MASRARRVVGLAALAVAATLGAEPVAGQGARLLADFNQHFETVPGSQPRQMVSLGDVVVFVADTPVASVWRSDGTRTGTFALLEEGVGGYPGPRILGRLGSVALFAPGGNESGGMGLWRTDGTALGTFSIANPSRWGRFYAGFSGSEMADPYHGRLYFVIDSYEDERSELWRTDGTAAGTELILQFPRALGYATIAVVDDHLLICFSREVWRSDGTAEGTLLAGMIPSGTDASIVAKTSSHAIVEVWDSGLVLYDDELYAIGGSGGVLERTVPKDEARWPEGRVYANGSDAAFLTRPIRAPAGGESIWSTDGTAAGSYAVTGTESKPRIAWFPDRWDDHPIAFLGERIFFLSDVSASVVDLLVTDREQRRGKAVLSLGRRAGLAEEHLWVVSVGGRLFFPRLGEGGLELWVSDGTSTGSSLLVDACPGSCDGRPRHPFVHGSRLFWVATDARGEQALWSTDGSSAGTQRLLQGMHSVGPERPLEGWHLAAAGRGWIFAATDFFRGSELWAAEQLADSGRIVADLSWDYFDYAGSRLSNVVTDGSETLLGVYLSRANEWKLFETDGVTPPRELLAVTSGSTLPEAVPLERGLVVLFSDWPGGALAVERGTGRVSEPFGFATDEAPQQFRVVGRVGHAKALLAELFAPAYWITDGSVDGSEQVSIGPCSGWADQLGTAQERFLLLGGRNGVCSFDTLAHAPVDLPGPPDGWGLHRIGYPLRLEPSPIDRLGRVYYEFRPPDAQRFSLWRSDGTREGTREVVSSTGGTLIAAAATGADLIYAVRPGNTRVSLNLRRDGETTPTEVWLSEANTPGGVADALIATDRGVLFGGWDPVHAGELWIADPADGTVIRLTDFADPGGPGLSSALRGRHLTYFTRAESPGTQLWRTDGTADGTLRIGPISGACSWSSVVSGDNLFFCHDDGIHGGELWRSDGSAAGTRLVADILPGSGGSEPQDLSPSGVYLYFTADDGVHGREVWVTPIDGGEPCRASETALCLGGGRFRVGMDRIAPDGHLESAKATPLSAQRGLFSFFTPDLYEVLVALEPSPSPADHTQVRIGSTSNVWFVLTVEDRATGTARRYLNSTESFASLVDPLAFGAPDSPAHGQVDIPIPAGRALEDVRASFSAEVSGVCVPGATRLCLLDGRYAVEARWRDGSGGMVPASVARFTAESGLLGAVGADDPTWVVKLLDARPLTGHLWFFYGGISPAELEVTVRETATGISRTYFHPSGQLPAAVDYETF